MASNDHRQRFEFISTIIGFIVDSREIAIWLFPVILSLFTGFTLIRQPEQPQIPGVNAPLGSGYQFVILLSGVLVYFHFLRRYWAKNKPPDNPAELLEQDDALTGTFQEFLWLDLPQLKRPLLLVPILLFFALWAAIISQMDSESDMLAVASGVVWFLLAIGAIALIADNLSLPNSDPRLNTLLEKWNSDQELQEKWMKRIEIQLNEQGSVNTLSFDDKVGLNLEYKQDEWQVNWAIHKYFRKHEFDDNSRLELSKPSYIKYGENPNVVEIEHFELRKRALDT